MVTPNSENVNFLSSLPTELLRDDETVVLALKPSLWFIPLACSWWLISAVSAACVFMLYIPWIYSGYTAAACLTSALLRISFAACQWAGRYYILTDQRIIRVRGVLNIDIFQCGLDKIQNTYLTLSFIQRIIGLGTIIFTTAGTAGIEAIWLHCSYPLKIHEVLQDTLKTNRA